MTHDLSKFNKYFGVLTDIEVAKLAGCHPNTVAIWRQRAGRCNAATLGGDSRAFQLRMPTALMVLIREVNERRVAAGRKSNLSGVMRDAMMAGLPLLET